MTIAPVGCRWLQGPSSVRTGAGAASSSEFVRASCAPSSPYLPPYPLSLPCACLCVAWCGRAVARSFSSATAHFIASFIRSLLVRIPASHFAGNMKKLLLICSCSRCAVVEIIGTWDAASSRAVHWRHSFWLPKCGI